MLESVIMEGNRFTYCPACGSKNIMTVKNGRKWECPDCSLELYNNVATAVGLLIADGSGGILFEKRAKEPRKGFLAFPGGFTDPDETVEEAAERECIEEIGVKPESLEYLCSYPNDYEYKGIKYKTCDLFFTAKIPEGSTIKAQESEVEGFVRMKIETKEDVENCPLAFGSAKKTLLKWIERRGK